MKEHFFSCPYCSSRISVLVDISLEKASYIEDCEVCCSPMQIAYTTQEGEIVSFDASSIEQ